MAINTNSSGGAKAAPSTATTSAMAAGIASNANDLIELNVIKRADATTTATGVTSSTAATTPILKRKGGGSKRLQVEFTTPEVSEAPAPRCISPRLIPSRKRYDENKFTFFFLVSVIIRFFLQIEFVSIY